MLNGEQPYPGAWALLPSLGAAAVLGAGSSRVLEQSGLQGIGRISYSWYLWHWPVLMLGTELLDLGVPATRLLLALLSLALAIVAYFLVEAPLRRSAKLVGRPALAGALIAMIGSAVLANAWQQHAFERDAYTATYARVKSDYPAIYFDHCDDWYRSADVRFCTSAPPAPRTAVAIGDSIGMQWYPALADLFHGPEWQLMAVTKSACPMVNAAIFYKKIGREYTECGLWRDAAIAAIEKLKPEVVVLGSTDSYALSEDQWIEGSRDVLRRLSAAAGRVVIVRATPSVPFDGPTCVSEAREPQAIPIIGRSCNAHVHDSRGLRVLSSLTEAASTFDNVSVVDMNDQVCPGGLCSATLGGIAVFRDRQHLTATFVQSLTAVLGSRIRID